jgi:hypothetical protein
MQEVSTQARGRRGGLRLGRPGRIGVVTLAAALAAVLPAGQALAATRADPGDPSSTGTTIANVDVGAAILLSNLTPSFVLSGLPGDSPADVGAVTMNVFTNNASGYTVTVQPAAADLVGTGSNTDTIPAADLSVRETGTGTYTPLDAGAPVQVYTQDIRSIALPGDALSNDYEFNTPIPDVHNDTYSVTIDYVASTNP